MTYVFAVMTGIFFSLSISLFVINQKCQKEIEKLESERNEALEQVKKKSNQINLMKEYLYKFSAEIGIPWEGENPSGSVQSSEE